MSAQSNVTVFDGAASPVSHVLVPMGAGPDPLLGNTARWRELLSSVPLGANVRLTTMERRLKNGTNRVELRVEIPVMESVSGQNAAGYTAPPRVAYTDTFLFVGYFSDRSTIANRRLGKQMIANLLNNVSTTVTAATSGMASELIDSGITAS